MILIRFFLLFSAWNAVATMQINIPVSIKNDKHR
jgi:hypothetical protein